MSSSGKARGGVFGRWVTALLIGTALLSISCVPQRGGGGGAPRHRLGGPAHHPLTSIKHVIIVSVDGLRPDAIPLADTPTLDRLIAQGLYSDHAETARPSLTLPSHVSMLTGLTVEHHGVTWNGYKPGFTSDATVFSEAKKAGLSTAIFTGKSKLLYLARPGTVDVLRGWIAEGDSAWKEGSSARVAEAFAREWTSAGFALTFIHLREPDSYGHGYDWMSPEYLRGVEIVDRALGSIISTLENAGSWGKTALILTSDHGGFGDHHKERRIENYTIPWLCVGPHIEKGGLLDRPIRTYDTCPTALRLLGLDPPTGIDGRAVLEVTPR